MSNGGICTSCGQARHNDPDRGCVKPGWHEGHFDPTLCGGCQGVGNHRKHCPRSPIYSRWLHLADRAEDLGDQIGPNDMFAANLAYAIAGRLRKRELEEPWVPLSEREIRLRTLRAAREPQHLTPGEVTPE